MRHHRTRPRRWLTVPGAPRGVKGKARVLCPPILALGLAACAQPAFVPDVLGALGPLVQEVPGLIVTVETDAWRARPSGLADTVFPLLVTVRNTGTFPVTVARQDFALLDPANRQYPPIPAADVAAMYGGGGGSGVAVSPSIGFGGATGSRPWMGGGIGVTFGSWGSDVRDIVPLAFPDGSVQPGAEVRGFLYFPRLAPDVREARLVLVVRELPGAPQLEFRFRRAP